MPSFKRSPRTYLFFQGVLQGTSHRLHEKEVQGAGVLGAQSITPSGKCPPALAVEADLAKALDEGLIAGAGIDVYVKEPLPSDSPLMHLQHPERLLLTPHIAWYSEEARARLAHEMAENIKKGW